MLINKFQFILLILVINKIVVSSGYLIKNGTLEESYVVDNSEKHRDWREAKKRPIDFKDFPSYEKAMEYLTYLKEKFPKQVNLIELGKTSEERYLKAVHVKKLLEFGEIYKPRPIIIIVSTFRGTNDNALLGALYILHRLLELESMYGYELNKYEFVIFPLVNPDGYAYATSAKVKWLPNRVTWDWHNNKSTCQGTLLEQNFGYHHKINTYEECVANRYFGNYGFFSAETQAVRKLVGMFESRSILYISLFASMESIEYPWAYSKENHPDAPRLRMIAEAGAKAIKEHSGRGRTMAVRQASVRGTLSGTDIDYITAVTNISFSFKMGIPDFVRNDMDEENATIQAIMDELLCGVLDMGYEALIMHSASKISSGCRYVGTYFQILIIFLFQFYILRIWRI